MESLIFLGGNLWDSMEKFQGAEYITFLLIGERINQIDQNIQQTNKQRPGNA